MSTIGTANTHTGTRLLLLGSGELGKEVALEAQRFGIEVIAVDRYAHAPAMQVAHRSHVIPMTDGAQLRAIVEKEKPAFIVPEIEAIATDTLLDLEAEGYNVIPTARAARLTMDREGIRRFAAEELDLRTSPYRFADTEADYLAAVDAIGFPCVVKPIMSSSGRGQSTLRADADVALGWTTAQEGARGGAGKVIVEGFVDFDYEITLLTVRHCGGTDFLDPIGHRQVDGDYHESWQPQPMSDVALTRSQNMAKAITDGLGGLGIFGVELFIKGDDVFFSEVSPRPHDTGMVTLAGTQNFSEFELHARAILGLPVFEIEHHRNGASAVVLAPSDVKAGQPLFSGVLNAASSPQTDLRLFGKPSVRPYRRMGVTLAYGSTSEDVHGLVERAKKAASEIKVSTQP